MVNYNAVGLDLSGITGAIDAYSKRRREEEEKRRNAAEVGAFGDRLLGTIATSGGAGGGAPSRGAELMGLGQRLPSFAGGTAKMGAVDPDLVPAVVEEATKRGLNPVDVLTTYSYETGGTLNPWQKGPRTKWGQHNGLIQWGEPQAAQYGVTAQTPVRQQVARSLDYMQDRGVRPGHGLKEIYSSVNAGGVGPQYLGRSDAHAGGAPGTVLDKVNNQMAGHRQRAEALLAGHKAPIPVTREAGTQQIQTASAADADLNPPGAPAPRETGQFKLPGGRGAVWAGSEVTPEHLETLRQGVRSRNPEIRAAALQEIQAIRARQSKGDEYDFKEVDKRLYRTSKRTGEAELVDTGASSAAEAAGPFKGTSLEAQALNHMVLTKQLTVDQAAQFAAGKVITDPSDNSLKFMTPNGMMSPPIQTPQAGPNVNVATAGPTTGLAAAAQPVGPAAGGQAGLIQITAPKPVKPEKPTEAEARNEGLLKVVEKEVPVLMETFKALGDPVNLVGDAAGRRIGGYRGLTSESYQRGHDALKSIAKSYLYSVSGAAASDKETEDLAMQAMPRPGEGDTARTAKLDRVKTWVEAIRAKAGAAGRQEAPSPGAPVVVDGYTIKRKN